MEDFYTLLKEFKESQSLSYTKLGKVINKTPDAFRQAVNRQSLSELEMDRLSQYFSNPFAEKNQLSAPLGADDLIAMKVREQLEPLIKEIRTEMVGKIYALDIEVTKLQEKLEEIGIYIREVTDKS